MNLSQNDFIGYILYGLFTGIGIKVAQEIWDSFKEYRLKTKKVLKNTVVFADNITNRLRGNTK